MHLKVSAVFTLLSNGSAELLILHTWNCIHHTVAPNPCPTILAITLQLSVLIHLMTLDTHYLSSGSWLISPASCSQGHTWYHEIGWIVFHSVYIPQFVYLCILQWMFGLLPHLDYFGCYCYDQDCINYFLWSFFKFLDIVFFYVWDKYSKVRFLDTLVILLLTSWGANLLFFTVCIIVRFSQF